MATWRLGASRCIRDIRAIHGDFLRLAEPVDLNIRTVPKFEAGKLNILLTTLLRIQRALSCPWNKLLAGK